MKLSTGSKKSTSNQLQRTHSVILLIVVYCLIVWFPTRHLSYHWDSAAFFIDAAKFLYDHEYWPLIAPYSEFAHPPLFPAMLALIWKLFGVLDLTSNFSFLASHLLILPFLPILLITTYFLGKKVSGPAVGLAATALVATIPFVLAEYGMPYIDLPSGALAALSLTLWIYHKRRLAIITLSLAVLIKFTVILMVIIFIIDYFFKPKSKNISTILYILIPCILIFVWLIYHYSITGWWLTMPGRDTVFKTNPLMFLNSLRFVGYVFFIRQYRFVLTGLTFLSLLYLYFKNPHRLKKLFTHNVLLLLITCILFLITYGFTGEFIPRYTIAILPAYTVFCIYWTTSIFSKQISWLLITVICVLFYTSWHPRLPPTQAFEFRINEDLSYQDHIAIGRQTAKYLEINYPEVIIYGGFPQRYQLTEPWQGYVTRPLNFKECNSYSLSAVHRPLSLLYIHPYHYTQIACHALLNQASTTLVKEFLVNGKWARLYQIK